MEIFGLIAVLVVSVITSRMNPALLASRFLQGILFYSMALGLIGYAGDDLYQWVLAHPNDAAIGAVAFYIVWIIVLFSGRSLSGSGSISRSQIALPAAATMASIRKPSAQDKRYMAAHEAGHALLYAALGTIPMDMRVVLDVERQSD